MKLTRGTRHGTAGFSFDLVEGGRKEKTKVREVLIK